MSGQPRFSLEEICRSVGGTVLGDAHVVITGVNSLEAAGSGDISFFSDRRYRKGLEKTRATAVIVREMSPVFKGSQILIPDPALAFARAAGLFARKTSAFQQDAPAVLRPGELPSGAERLYVPDGLRG